MFTSGFLLVFIGSISLSFMSSAKFNKPIFCTFILVTENVCKVGRLQCSFINVYKFIAICKLPCNFWVEVWFSKLRSKLNWRRESFKGTVFYGQRSRRRKNKTKNKTWKQNRKRSSPGMMALWLEAEAGGSQLFKISLFHKASSKTAMATQRCCHKNTKQNRTKQSEIKRKVRK